MNPFKVNKQGAPAQEPRPLRTHPATGGPLVLNPLSILTAEQSRKAIYDHYNFGTGNGETTHFPDIDKHWTWKRGELTTVTGYPNHGKSELMIQLMVFKAYFDGWRFCLFVPENMPAELFFVKIIQAYIGASANAKDQDRRMSVQDLERGLVWVNEYFFVVNPQEDELMTPDLLLAYFDFLYESVGLDGVMLDPWNQLEHQIETGGREDLYISKVLTRIKKWALKRKVCFIETAHPAGEVTDRQTGELKVPKAHMISGGKMFNNKSDNVLAVHRPNFPDSATELHVHKIKQWGLVGKPGVVMLDYNPESFRYFAPTGARNPLDKVNPPRCNEADYAGMMLKPITAASQEFPNEAPATDARFATTEPPY
ncbi:hypothetical protein LJ737_20855 [Hymenobacter sp. 15J16-1T3B]|uniref:hypothetical protein n=1 Tax=Hymenobacter sp. 15J16-1T3B TaxID=2886941 RepID=UPI001D1113DC|nr:hypothetical protein [Hymenobacter sp. 15J16-1T3B]MCC3159704.1 hypothetical protein [Hymenobacter sp. 15J16-1T3B]